MYPRNRYHRPNFGQNPRVNVGGTPNIVRRTSNDLRSTIDSLNSVRPGDFPAGSSIPSSTSTSSGLSSSSNTTSFETAVPVSDHGRRKADQTMTKTTTPSFPRDTLTPSTAATPVLTMLSASTSSAAAIARAAKFRPREIPREEYMANDFPDKCLQYFEESLDFIKAKEREMIYSLSLSESVDDTNGSGDDGAKGLESLRKKVIDH
ncbi:hypothetical protein BGZ83_005793 [Gryganskiella cystojenkinii]|nr:hypothetical protein BGZ83_005793 [Gryganskiella cystojenkinii]